MFSINDFWKEIEFFYELGKQDLVNGFKKDEVNLNLSKCVEAFYGSRLEMDKFSTKKSWFIISNLDKIINGESILDELD